MGVHKKLIIQRLSVVALLGNDLVLLKNNLPSQLYLILNKNKITLHSPIR